MSKSRGMDPHLVDILARAAANAPTPPQEYELFDTVEVTLRKNAEYRRQVNALTDLHIAIPLSCADGRIVLEKPRGANFFEFDASRRGTSILLFGKAAPSVEKKETKVLKENVEASQVNRGEEDGPQESASKEEPNAAVVVDASEASSSRANDAAEETKEKTEEPSGESRGEDGVDAEVKPEVKPEAEPEAAEVESGEVESGEVESGEVESGEVESGAAAESGVVDEQPTAEGGEAKQADTPASPDGKQEKKKPAKETTPDGTPSACDVWASYMQVRMGTVYNVRPEQMSTVLQLFNDAFHEVRFPHPLSVAFSGLYNHGRNANSGETRVIETLGVPLMPEDGARWDHLKVASRRFASDLILYSRRFELAARNPPVPVAVPGGVRLPVPGRPTMPAPLPHEQPRLRVELARFVGHHPMDVRVLIREHRALSDKGLLRLVRDPPRKPVHRTLANSAVMALSEIRLEHMQDKSVDPRWPKMPILSRKVFNADRPARHLFCPGFIPPRVRQADEVWTKDPRPEYKRVSKGVCRFERTAAGCYRGDACTFSHSVA